MRLAVCKSLILKRQRCWRGRLGTLGNCADGLRWRAADFDCPCRTNHLIASGSPPSIAINLDRTRRIDRVTSQVSHNRRRAEGTAFSLAVTTTVTSAPLVSLSYDLTIAVPARGRPSLSVFEALERRSARVGSDLHCARPPRRSYGTTGNRKRRHDRLVAFLWLSIAC